jgi:cytidine deaminase
LIAAARDCLSRAYAPYSKLSVAAAVVDDDGRIFTGVNVENASYGLTMCAERVAIFNAIAAGATKLRSLAVVAKSSAPVMPCGACRQVMAEFFDPPASVYSGASAESYKESTVGELLPDAFGPDDL